MSSIQEYYMRPLILSLCRFALTGLLALMVVAAPASAKSIEQRITVSLPPGNGPFPVVILMHWTSGPGSAEKKWANTLNANGIAAVTLKSYNRITGGFSTYEARVPERITHLQQAYAYVSAQSWSNGRISVLGRSHGAWAVIDALKAGAIGSKLYRAVASAPRCGGPRGDSVAFKSRTPLLIVVGKHDRVTSPSDCKKFAARARAKGEAVSVVQYPAGHEVDIKSRAAMRQILAFLKR
jgi:dienelactone hydrolase